MLGAIFNPSPAVAQDGLKIAPNIRIIDL